MKSYWPALLLAIITQAGFCQQNIASFREITATQALGSRILFSATHDQYGAELFVSDGDSKSVTLLKDINTGSQGSAPGQLTVFNSQVFFIAYTRDFGASVWKTDGTPQGTHLVYGIKNAEPHNLMVFKDRLYFTTNLGSIIRTDGTVAGTQVFYQSPSNYGRVQTIIKDDQYIYFTADNRTIFRDNGVARISFLGPLSWEDVYFRNIFTLGDKLVVIKAGSSDNIIRVYAIDNSIVHDQGEDEWTLIKKMDAPIYGSQYLANFTVIGEKLFFNYRKSYDNVTPSDELWACDGTDAGTRMLKSFRWIPYMSNSNMSMFFEFHGKLFFEAGESEKKAIWTSDGTPEGTVKFHDATIEAPYNDQRRPLLVADDKFYFGGGDPYNAELWLSDGTTSGTRLLLDIEDTGASWPHDLSYSNGIVYFVTSKQFSSTLWSTSPAPDISLWGSLSNNPMPSGTTPMLFYNVAKGSCQTSELFILNKGLSELYLRSIYLTGRDFYLVEQTLPEKLAPGESVAVKIVFNPVVDGKSNATLSILSNDADEPRYVVELQATTSPTATGQVCNFPQRQYVKILEYGGKNGSPIVLSNSTITEGLPIGTVIGQLSFSASATYVLVAGEGDADNKYFLIDGNQLRSTAVFDYNERSLYTIRVKAVTADGSSETSFRINISNISREITATECQARFQPMGYAISALESNPAGHLFATTSLGHVLRSVDAGKTWETVYTGDYFDIVNITFKGNTGFIAGSGILLKSEDGGATWFRLYVPIKYGYYYNTGAAYFLNDKEGYVGSENGEIFFTSDGGRSWEARLQDDYTKFRRIWFRSRDKGYAIVEYGDLMETADGGRTWLPIDLTGLGWNTRVGSIFFTSEKNGFLVTDYYLYKTTNGGQSWTQVLGISGGLYSSGINFLNESVGFLYGAEGVLYKTINGGDTWEPIYATGAPGRLVGVAQSTGKLFLASRGYNSNYETARAISVSSDEGLTWSNLSNYTATSIRRIQFYSTATGLIVTPEGLFRTKDNGITWTQATTDLTNVHDVLLLDENTAMLVSDGNIYKSSDAGMTTRMVLRTDTNRVSSPAGKLYAFPNALYSVNWNVMYRSDDSGESWKLVSNMQDTYVQDIQFISSSTGYRVDLFGSVDKSTDGGKTWNTTFTRDPTESNVFNAIFFLDENIGYKGGNFLQRTIDGGHSWETVNWAFYEIMAIHFENEAHGFVVTRTGIVHETVDGGETWKEILYTSSRILTVQFRDGEIYLAGENGFSARMNATPRRPSMPGYIYGPDRICVGDAVDFRVAVDNDYRTLWTTTGGNIEDRREYMTVKFDKPGEYTLTAKYVNTCGTSDVRLRTVNVSGSSSAPRIEGPDSAVKGEEDMVYAVANVTSNASFLWSAEGGIATPAGDRNVSVDWANDAISGKVNVLQVDASGCRAYGSLVVSLELPLAIEDYLDEHISIYPNPSDGDTKLSSSHESVLIVRIIDVRGYEYSRYTLFAGDVQNLHTQHLSAGLYLIEISDGEQTVTKKLIRK